MHVWPRYLVGLTLLAAIALAPLVWLALRVPVPVDAAQAKTVVQLGWGIAAIAWIGQLVLVGGVAPAVRGVRAGAAPSQRVAFTSGLAQLLRAIIPCALVVIAVVMSSVALVVPGALVLVLLALTGASTAHGLPAQLVDSVAVARTQLGAIAMIVGAMIVADLAIAVIAHRLLVVPLPAKPTAAQLAMACRFVRAVVAALIVVSPLPAIALATLYTRGSRAA